MSHGFIFVEVSSFSVLTTSSRPICFPLPAVANSSTSCNGMASLMADTSCGAVCLEGFELVGNFTCGPLGDLMSVPECVAAGT